MKNRLETMEFEQIKEKNFTEGFASLRDIRKMGKAVSEGAMTKEEVIAQRGKEVAEVITHADIAPQSDVLDRQVIAGFRDYFTGKPQRDLSRIVARRPLKNPRDFKDIIYTELENFSEKRAQQGYRCTKIGVSQRTHSLKYYGRLVECDGEAWDQDDENILSNLPTLLGQAGRRTINRLIAEAIGLEANRNLIYTAPNGNLGSGALTSTNLENALISQAALLEETSGEPRGTVMATLVVPLELEYVAQRLVKPDMATLALASLASGRVDYKLDYIASPYLSRYTTTGWWLFAEPEGNQAPVVDAYVNGEEEPEIFIRAADAEKIKGGMDPKSFFEEVLSWKGRMRRNIHVLPELFWMTYFSTGTAS